MTDAAATELIHAQVPLCATLGITADTFRPDEVVLSLDWAPNLCTGNDMLHGGMVMTLADSAGEAVDVAALGQEVLVAGHRARKASDRL